MRRYPEEVSLNTMKKLARLARTLGGDELDEVLTHGCYDHDCHPRDCTDCVFGYDVDVPQPDIAGIRMIIIALSEEHHPEAEPEE